MNSKAIADAIAAQFTGVTYAGKTLTGTASLPNAISKGPELLVFHPTGDLEYGMSKTREDVLLFPVRLLSDPANYPQRSDALYGWYDVIRDKVGERMRLGLTYVEQAEPVSVRIELDGFVYGGQGGVICDVVEFIVRVKLYEVVTSLAP